MRKFSDLSEQEVLALAITLEGEDERVYADFTDGLKATYPATAAVFDGMVVRESTPNTYAFAKGIFQGNAHPWSGRGLCGDILVT